MKFAVVVALSQLIGGLQGVPGAARDQAVALVSGLPDTTIHTLLDSANWRGRDGAVTGLAEAAPPRLGLLLEIGRRHPKLAARRSAIRAIGRAGESGYCDTLRTFLGRGSDSVILDAMGEREDCQNFVVDPYLSDPDADVRRRAFQLLVSTNREKALAVSEIILGDPNYGVRQVVADFLIRTGDDALPLLRSAAADTSRLKKSTALTTLGRMGEVGRTLLTGLFGSLNWYDRVIAADGLGRIGGEDAVASIDSRLQAETHPLVLMSLKRARAQALREQP